jgi:hypothetical protein
VSLAEAWYIYERDDWDVERVTEANAPAQQQQQQQQNVVNEGCDTTGKFRSELDAVALLMCPWQKAWYIYERDEWPARATAPRRAGDLTLMP